MRESLTALPLGGAHPDLARVRRLYESAFPANERRPFEALLSGFDGQGELLALYHEGRFAGFISLLTCADITHAVLEEEVITSPRRYHTITEAKNGEGAPPIRTEKGWLHIAHGVRNTAAGLRYVLYLFVTDLAEPWRVIAEPSGYLLAPLGGERVGDVSNVVFTNGAIARDTGEVYIYYASSDTRLHVASTTVDKLLDYAFNTPADPLRSRDCVAQRCALIDKNLAYLNGTEQVCN